jgi:hypothetical protein
VEGMRILKTIQMKLRAGDPLDHIISVLEQMRDNSDARITTATNNNTQFQAECNRNIE